jgi:hypothetical protein
LLTGEMGAPTYKEVALRMFTREFDELVAKKLRDPDWKFLRTDRR